jgi:hypothetical protein
LCNQIKEYTFLYGGEDQTWIKRFYNSVNVVAEDPVIKEALISIKSHKGKRTDPWNQEIRNLLISPENESEWAVLTKGPTRTLVIDHGTTILNVLEEFEEWKKDVHKRGFETCLKEYHKHLQTRPPP